MSTMVLDTIHYVESAVDYTLSTATGKRTQVKNTDTSAITITLPEGTTVSQSPDSLYEYWYDGTVTLIENKTV